MTPVRTAWPTLVPTSFCYYLKAFQRGEIPLAHRFLLLYFSGRACLGRNVDMARTDGMGRRKPLYMYG
jgi:hypothetical protein